MNVAKTEAIGELREIVDQLISTGKLDAERKNLELFVQLTGSTRQQRIAMSVRHSVYEFTTVIANVTNVIGSTQKARRDLQFRIWRRNALKPVVALYIDDQDQIIGRITCTIESAHADEVSFYLATLARDCDRFEYILSGSDEY